MTWLDEITPRHIQELVPYASARREASSGEVWLNANENPYASPKLAGLSQLNRYPEFQPEQLTQGFARYAGMKQEEVLVTRGIDEGIDLLTRAFCRSGEDNIIYTPPTYGMYKISAETNNIGALSVPLEADWFLDVQGILQQLPQSKLIYLCSPNNPTGSLLDKGDICKIIEAAAGKALVVVDEAYVEFRPEFSMVSMLSKYPNLVVMRTLSKAFGLAGLRCGFLLASPEIIEVLQKVSAPYPIPIPVVDVASEALSEKGIDAMMRDVETLTKDRDKLSDMLREFSFIRKIYPSSANFILFQVKDATAVMTFLLDKDVVIRNQSSQPGLDNTMRVSVGTENEIEKFYQNMKAYEASL
ncbi:MAG: histidinol-phosphate transaminase [Candidatus Marinimicrobia bacterium]|nr:histidinol-phosphate transaminase [Candidatus Neomarinimicrobiota bacterium]